MDDSPGGPLLDMPGIAQARAIEALTALARQRQHADDGSDPVDFAGELVRILAAVTANVGGRDHLLAGRWGSREAQALSTLVGGTLGRDGEHLPRYRTDPITVWIDPRAQLHEHTGAAWEALEDAAYDEFEDVYAAALARHAGHPQVMTDQDRRRLERSVTPGQQLTREQQALWKQLADEGAWLLSNDADLATAHRLLQAVAAARDTRERDYARRLLAATQAAALRHGYAVELTPSNRYDPANSIGNDLVEQARETTPAPAVPTLDELR